MRGVISVVVACVVISLGVGQSALADSPSILTTTGRVASIWASVSDPGQAENLLAGSTQWYAPVDGATIQGYTSEVSVAPGGQLQLHVRTTPAGRYRVEVYRLGWCGGDGGRL